MRVSVTCRVGIDDPDWARPVAITVGGFDVFVPSPAAGKEELHVQGVCDPGQCARHGDRNHNRCRVDKIVSSFVGDLLMPPIGLLLGKVHFANLYINLSGQSYPSLAAANAAGAAAIKYGTFLNTVLDFLIVALAVLMLVKQVNRLHRQPATAPAEPTVKDYPYCLSSIPIKATRGARCTSQL